MLLLAVCFFFYKPIYSQKNSLKGTIVDTAEKKKLHYSIVALIDRIDTTLYRSVRTNVRGEFELTQLTPGKYTLLVSYPKMADYLQDITITDTSKIDLKTIPMITKAELLQEVVVRAGLPVRMRGDTLEYTADSFAVKPGVNVEELLKRLPGIEVDKDGKIVAQGQEVKKILVDGDEFFSDDPSLASRYLQADAIDRVQVFDDKSEQSKLSGMDDGKRNKTINLKLKKNRKNGYFGKLAAGSNGNDYHHNEAMGALFDGNRKISAFGLSSKIGKKGLSNNEMDKYVATDYEVIDDGTGNIVYRENSEYESEHYYGDGLPSVQSGGAHYSEKWNYDKQKLFTNYRIRQVNATGWSNFLNTTVLPDGTSFTNKRESQEKTYSFMQKASGSFAFNVDSFSVIKISANGNLANSNEANTNFSNSTNEKGFQVNTSEQVTNSDNQSKNFASNISYQRKFRKDGRTLSMLVQQEYNNRTGNSYHFTTNKYYDPASGQFRSTETLNQLQQSTNSYASYAAKLNYTDKISSDWKMSFEYGLKNDISGNVFNTLNNVNDKFTDRVDTLSNDYTFNATTHIAGATLVFNPKKLTVALGGNAFFTGFTQENNDLNDRDTRHFINITPRVNFSYRPKQTTNFSFYYNGHTVQPSVEQLQPLRRSSNKLNEAIGNPYLKPGFRHSGNLTYYKSAWEKGKYFYSDMYIFYTSNSVANSTFTDAQNRTTTRYINLNSIPYISLSASYGWQYKKYHLKPNASFYMIKSGDYNIQNDQKLKRESLTMNATFSLTHEWKNVMTTGYKGNVNNNMAWSNIPGSSSTRSIYHSHNVNMTAYLPWHLELSSDCTFNFQPKNGTFNTNFNTIQWNAFMQKKFLKNDQAVIKFSVSDILNNNTGYRRNVYGSNVYEEDRLVIKRYWLLTMAWNFSKSIK